MREGPVPPTQDVPPLKYHRSAHPICVPRSLQTKHTSFKYCSIFILLTAPPSGAIHNQFVWLRDQNLPWRWTRASILYTLCFVMLSLVSWVTQRRQKCQVEWRGKPFFFTQKTHFYSMTALNPVFVSPVLINFFLVLQPPISDLDSQIIYHLRCCSTCNRCRLSFVFGGGRGEG